MPQLWLPTAQMKYGQAKSFPAGTLILGLRGNNEGPVPLGMRVDRPPEDGGDLALVFTLTSDWHGGKVPAGKLISSDEINCLGLLLMDGQSLGLEADVSASGNYPEGGGAVSWYKDGPRMLGYYSRRGDPYSHGLLEIEPTTWRVWTRPPDDPGPIMHSAKWRLRLRLSEYESVIVADGPPAKGHKFGFA